MADKSVANLSISNSYAGILRISTDATGATSTPVQVYTSDGAPTALLLSDSSAIITGTLDVEGNINATAATTEILGVTGETFFGNAVTFSMASSDKPGVINAAGVIFKNEGTFKSTGAIISEGTANFTTLSCSGKTTFGSYASFGDSDDSQNNILTVTLNKIIARGDEFTVTTTNTIFSNPVTFNSSVNLGANTTAVTPPANDSSNKIATTSFVKTVTQAGTPVGTIQIYAGTTAPAGYLFCQGQEISKSTYKELFAVIGYIYGGSGGKFKLPDFRGVFPRGHDAGRDIDSGRQLGSVQQSGAPNITGTGPRFTHQVWNGVGTSGAIYRSDTDTGSRGENGDGGWYGDRGWNLDASRSSSVYQNGLNEVRPVNIAVNFIIKY